MTDPTVPPFAVKRIGEYTTSRAVVSSVGPTAVWIVTFPEAPSPFGTETSSLGVKAASAGAESASASAEAPPMMASRVSFFMLLPRLRWRVEPSG